MGIGRIGWAGGSTGVARSRRRHPLGLAACAAFLITLAIGPAPAPAQETNRVLLYTGTTGFRHADAINQGRPVVQAALEDAGYTVDWEDCTGFGTAGTQCQAPDENPRVFSDANLANYDAILFLNSSDFFSGTGGNPGQLFGASNTTESTPQREAIIDFVQNGGGIAAVHNMTDAGAGVTTWDWWDANNGNSVVGSTMKGHAATNINNVAQVQVADRNHPSTRDLPSTYGFGDEHYNFTRSVRGDHHVLTTLDERTYAPVNPMGYDHPITWCKLYDGDNVDDATGEPKPYSDGRTWITGMGHFGSSFTENGGDNNLVKTIVGGVRWAAGEGLKSDCSGTVWSSFQRTILVPDANAPIGLDVAPDGKVYWSEIGTGGSYPNFTSTGSIMMHDPEGPAGNKTTVATIETRADHANSEDGVLGMALSPNFATDRNVFVYYSPRNPGWPTSGNEYVVGYNVISRFTLNAAGDAVVPGSEREILRVPKVKLAGNPSWCTGCPSGNGPGHVGGAGLDFDSEGNLYLGVGDDVSPNESGHNAYPPLDYRAQEHRDARKTAANTGDLRGKVVRVQPFLGDIPAGTEPGVDQTYAIPEGNMFPPGTANARPEIYAMGFRQPFTLHTDPAQPGVVGVGEFCHDNGTDGAQRAPAGVCEWNLLDEPGFQGWPFCVGNNSAALSSFRWDYASGTSTGQQYDCSLGQIPSDLDYAPAGQSNPGPTNPGLANIPGPAEPATIWKKIGGANQQNPLDFGNLSAGGNQPVAGPIYRYDEAAGPNAFPRYYDGSWFILNRGGAGGFWKEVRRTDDGELLKVNDWIPDNAFGTPATSQVIGTQFGPDGALYAARFPVGCCRNETNPENQVQIVKFEFSVQDECLEDLLPPNTSHEVEGQAHPTEPDTYLIGGLRDSADLRITANDQGCAGVDHIEYREAGTTEWTTYDGAIPFDTAGDYEIEYRAIDRFDPPNTSEIATASFSVVDANDTTPPAVEASLSGSQNEDGDYVGSAELDLEATDEISGITSIEHSVNGGQFEAAEFEGNNLSEATEVEFDQPGTYVVAYRATDSSGNTSTDETIEFTVVEQQGCVPALSDEFDGNSLDSKWEVVRRDDERLSVADGALNLLAHPDDIFGGTNGDLANIVLQPLPGGGEEPWSITTELTWEPDTNFQNAGLMIYEDDDNYIKTGMVWNGARNFELVKETDANPTFPGGSTPAGSVGDTFFLRYISDDGNSVDAQFSADGQSWTDIGTTGTDLSGLENPRIGVYATAAGAPEITASFHSVTIEPDDQTCPPGSCLSDEFDGSTLDPKWNVRVEEPGEHSMDDGQLVLPILNEIDGTVTGPLSFVSQQVPEGDWSLTTRVTPDLNTSWAQAGIMLWQSDGNFIKYVFGRDANSGDRRVEMSSDNPTDTRQIGPSDPVPNTTETVWLRLYREGNTIAGEYALDDGGEPGEWVTHSGTRPVDTTPPREGEGVQLGLYAGSDVDGAPYEQQASFDFARFEPDECDEEDTEAPTTTVQLNGAPPVASYDGPVEATFTAIDNEGGSGVENTFYSVDGGPVQMYDALMPPTIGEPGEHTIEYYSTDVAGNEETPHKSVSFTIAGGGDDTTPPVTTASTDPPAPGPHDGPVDVTLSATDPGGEVEPQTHEVDAEGFQWNPDEVNGRVGDTVNWDFNNGGHDACLGDEDPGSVSIGECGEDEELGDFNDGDTGGSKLLDQAGQFFYYCTYHYPSMVGDLNVEEAGSGPASGVETITYSIDGGPDVVVENTNGDDPFLTEFTVSEPGEHTVTYFSTDVAGNAEEEQTLTFTIEDDGTTGPELDLSVKPRKETVKGRQKASFTATLANVGDEAASDVELCAKAPRRLVELKGKECAATSSLEPDADIAPEFTFKPTRKARGKKVEITFTASASNAEDAVETATLKVKARR
jgi:glucose/arabinose dehydrogenase/plastocyanin/regulation of enolase protein 1 (concanavalin A-like superfamily)